MKTNLIQNYILTQNGNSPIKESPKKPKPEFNIKRELDNRTFIKPLRAKGRLVKNNIFYAPINMVKDVAYDVKSMKHALHGEANDHELGKLNDVGMKFGGLAIASYLFSQKQTPKTKLMEFVGLGSFFASMVLWKKIGIQLPAQIIHGVNVDQQYEDSFGRKKPFYLDPQFLPWDLYTEDQINKIGDRLGVPRDIENRRDFIQEKMKKIAVQNNTLWMLTAGFATPVMSALICNSLEKPIAKYLDNRQNKYADKLLENYETNYSKFRDESVITKLNKALEIHSDKPLTNQVFNEITDILTEGFDLITSKAIKQDLKAKLFKNTYSLDKSAIDALVKNMKKELQNTQKFSEKAIEAIVPNKEQISELFNEYNLQNKSISKHDFNDILALMRMPLEDNIKNFNANLPEGEKAVRLKSVTNALIAPKDELNPIIKGLQTVSESVLDSTAQAKLRDLGNIFVDFKAKIALLDKYAYIKAGAAPETVIANYWNNFAEDLTKILKITPKEIESVRYDRELMAKLLQSKVETICANSEEYKNVVTEVVHRMAHLQSLIKPSDISNRYNKHVNSLFDSIAAKLSDASKDRVMPKTVDALLGKEVIENGKKVRKPSGSLKNIQLTYLQNRIDNVKNSFNWILSFLDYNRRIASLTNVQALHSGIRREVKEEMVALTKLFMLQGHAADFATKGYFKRNPEPLDDFSQIEVKNGVVQNKYLGHTGNTRVDIPQNAQFFDEGMKLMFDNPIHPETEHILTKNAMLDQIKTYRKNILDYIGKDFYFAKPRHLAWGQVMPSSADKRYLLLGAAPDEMLSKIGKQAYNSRKWLKMFGGFGAGLLGVTVLSQFFFGKMKTPERIQQKGN